MNDKRLRSHKKACPSEETVKNVLKALLTAIVVTGVLCPKRLDLGSSSTGLPGTVCSAYTETTQSSPAVIRVLESLKDAQEICPMWRFSKRPAGLRELAGRPCGGIELRFTFRLSLKKKRTLLSA